MLTFFLAVLLGAAVTYLCVSVIGRRAARSRLHDDALLRAHVRSLLILAEGDLLHPSNPQARDLVSDTRALLRRETLARGTRAP